MTQDISKNQQPNGFLFNLNHSSNNNHNGGKGKRRIREGPLRLPILFQIIILKKVMDSSDGKDKVLKIIQYSSKVGIWLYLQLFHNNKSLVKNDQTPSPPSIKKISSLTKQLSMSRKMIRLGHWLDGIQQIYDMYDEFSQGKSTPWKKMNGDEKRDLVFNLSNIGLGILNDMCDDLVCLSKMGMIGQEYNDKYTPISDRLWFLTILLDLNDNMNSTAQLISKLKSLLSSTVTSNNNNNNTVSCMNENTQQKKQSEEIDHETHKKLLALKNKLVIQHVSFSKLLCDLMFCSFDVFGLEGSISDGWQSLAGLCAAILSTFKIIMKMN